MVPGKAYYAMILAPTRSCPSDPDYVIHAAVIGRDGGYECVLEEPGCPMTRYFLCAQRVANSTGTDIMRLPA